jgi:hypothetical protein
MRTILIALAAAGVLSAQEQGKHIIETTATQRLDLPAGGTLRLRNSTGELTIEGWDRPAVEITTVKSTQEFFAPSEKAKADRELARVRITAVKKGDEVLVTTSVRHCTSVDVDYRIRAPYGARLVVEHGKGEVHVVNVTGDSRIRARSGGITMDLPEGAYAVDAKSAVGNVISDFSGTEKRKHLVGREFTEQGAAHHLYLRTTFGDILLLKAPKGLGPGQQAVR